MEQYIVVFVTCSSKIEADELGGKIVRAGLAACANIINGVNSIFHWQNKINAEEESLMILKTRKKLLDDVVEFVQMHHSYDVPEIIALPIVGGSKAYLKWIKTETLSES